MLVKALRSGLLTTTLLLCALLYPATSMAVTYTASQVAAHNNQSSCWTIIDNNVYDVTQWFSYYGEYYNISQLCGIDGSSIYNSQFSGLGGSLPAYRIGEIDVSGPVISSVSVGSVGPTSATVTWTTDEPAEVQIEYGTTISYGTLSAYIITPLTSHSITLSGLQPSTLYHYRIKAIDALDNVRTSGDFTFTTTAVVTDTTPPSITGVGVSTIASSSAVITWTTSEGADTQVEYGATNAYGTQTSLNTQLLTSHSTTLTGLAVATTYYYRVRSKDFAGNLSTFASTFSTLGGTVGGPDNTPPIAPTSLTITGASSISISLSWTPSTDANGVRGYIVQRCQDANCSNFLGVADVTSGTTYTASNLTFDRYYRFRVQAYDASYNFSSFSNIVGGIANPTQMLDTTKPSAPTNLVASSTYATVFLSWTAATDDVGIAGYKVFRNGAIVASTTNTTYAVTGLALNSSYTFEVVAYDAAGNNSFLSNAVITSASGITDSAPPSAPLNFIVTSTSSPTEARLTWTISTDNVAVAGYNIYRDGDWIATTSSNFYEAGNLARSRSYVFQVAAFDAAQNVSSRTSATLPVRISDMVAPSIPQGLIALPTSNSQVKLTWSPSTDTIGVAGYNVYRDGLVIANPTSTSFFDPYVTLPVSYAISAFDDAGNKSGLTVPVIASMTGTPGSLTPNTSGKTLLTQDLAVGMQSSEVLLLQQTLQRLGYYPSTEKPNGYYGPSTQIAVRSFQYANPPLAVDGAVSANVRNLLNNVLLVTNAVAPLPVATVSAPTAAAPIPSGGSLSRNLTVGDSGADVSLLQKLLINEGSYPEGIVSGYFGALTQKAVQRFQIRFNIITSGDPSTTGFGAVGPRTRAKMNSMLAGLTSGISVTSPATPSPSPAQAKFSVGEKVHTTSAINIRVEPSLSGMVLEEAAQNTAATTLEGPKYASGYSWWRLRYSTSVVGWSAENFLESGGPSVIAAPTPAPAAPPARPPISLPTYSPIDTSNQIPPQQFPAGTKVYTSADLYPHSTASSCWTVIDGVVYDLTNWVDQHPGGRSKILGLCGIDGSRDFHAQHGTNALQVSILQGFKVGPYTR